MVITVSNCVDGTPIIISPRVSGNLNQEWFLKEDSVLGSLGYVLESPLLMPITRHSCIYGSVVDHTRGRDCLVIIQRSILILACRYLFYVLQNDHHTLSQHNTYLTHRTARHHSD